MATQTMRRKPGDNVYHHPDFHGGLSCGLDYIEDHYGREAVLEYLRIFARVFYKPLKDDLQRRGLQALREHFETLYKNEGGEVAIACTADELVLDIAACPAVMHLRRQNYPVARMWRETSRTVNESLCEGTPFNAEMLSYDEQTGRSVQRFFRRPS